MLKIITNLNTNFNTRLLYYMKKSIVIISLLVAATLALPHDSVAQFELDKKASNIKSQPVWGPVGHNYVSHYYLPEVDVYYDVNNQQFIIRDNSKWIMVNVLPKKYNKLDLYTTYKVVMPYDDPQPYKKNKQHRRENSNYKKASKQLPILDASKVDDRYHK